jgi:hypothetical protein
MVERSSRECTEKLKENFDERKDHIPIERVIDQFNISVETQSPVKSSSCFRKRNSPNE